MLEQAIYGPNPANLQKVPPVARDILGIFYNTTNASGEFGSIMPIPISDDQIIKFEPFLSPNPGHFYIYGEGEPTNLNLLDKPREIVVVRDYLTAEILFGYTGNPIVAAFTEDNVIAVIEALHALLPKKIIINACAFDQVLRDHRSKANYLIVPQKIYAYAATKLYASFQILLHKFKERARRKNAPVCTITPAYFEDFFNHNPDPDILEKRPPVERDILTLFVTTTTVDGTTGPRRPIPLNSAQKKRFGDSAIPDPEHFYIYGFEGETDLDQLETSDEILVVLDYFTAETFFGYTGHPVVVAFTDKNANHVVRALRPPQSYLTPPSVAGFEQAAHFFSDMVLGVPEYYQHELKSGTVPVFYVTRSNVETLL